MGNPISLKASHPWMEVRIDNLTTSYAGHLKSQYSSVLIAVCICYGFVTAKNIRSMHGHHNAAALENIIEHYGPPEVVKSDNGQIKCKEVADLFRSYGTTYIHSAAYNP